MLWLLLACATEVADTAAVVEIEPLDPVPLLIRTSLDLRGIRPTPEEMAAIEADPDALAGMVDEYLYHDNFPERVEWLYSRWVLTNTGVVPFNDDTLGLEPGTFYARSGGLEVPRIIRRVAELDMPYAELVTGD